MYCLADKPADSEQYWGGTVGGDPGKHVAIELPSGHRANLLVLEGCHGDGSDTSLLVHLRSRRMPSLPGLPSAQDKCLVGSKDFAVGGARLEVAQESENQCHSERIQGRVCVTHSHQLEEVVFGDSRSMVRLGAR